MFSSYAKPVWSCLALHCLNHKLDYRPLEPQTDHSITFCGIVHL